MKKVTSDRASKKYTVIMALGIVALVFLILVNITGGVHPQLLLELSLLLQKNN